MSWVDHSLDELGFLSRGKSKHRPRNDPILYGGQYPFIQTADVKHAQLYIASHSQTYNNRGLDQSKLWPRNTLCITIAANIADTALLGYEACFPDSIIGFVADPDKCDVRYIKYYFDVMQAHYKKISQGAAQDNLSQRKLLSLKVPTPPVPVQRKIANYLTAYNDLIANNNRRIELLEEAMHLLYREWFVHLRFPGWEETEIVDGVPEGWEKLDIARVCSSVEDGDWIETKDQGGSDYRLTQVSNIGIGQFNETGKYRYITEETFVRLKCQEIKVGDILVSRMPKPIGRAWLVNDVGFRMITAVDVAILKADEEIIHPLLLTRQMNSPYFLALAESQASGTTRPRITRRNLSKLPVMVPSTGVQQEFIKHAEPVYHLQNTLRRQNDNLIAARDALLPRLMSGRIEV